jgi:hypothetical protein
MHLPKTTPGWEKALNNFNEGYQTLIVCGREKQYERVIRIIKSSYNCLVLI